MKKLGIRILKKIGLLRRISLITSIELNGKRYKVSVSREVGYDNYFNLSEPWMLHVLNCLVKNWDPGLTFIDVGVNLGQTLIKVKSVNESVRYIGFEPNPLCVNYVNELIRENEFLYTDIIPVGINDETTILKLKLFNDSDVDSAASIIEGFRNEGTVKRSINVPVFKYSDVPLAKDIKIGIIKIDVEGAELEVLSGFQEHLKIEKPIILIEILPAYNTDNTLRISRQLKIQELLRGLDYTILRVIKQEEKFKGIEEVDEFGIHSDLNLCEYILTPSKKKNIVITTLAS